MQPVRLHVTFAESLSLDVQSESWRCPREIDVAVAVFRGFKN